MHVCLPQARRGIGAALLALARTRARRDDRRFSRRRPAGQQPARALVVACDRCSNPGRRSPASSAAARRTSLTAIRCIGRRSSALGLLLLVLTGAVTLLGTVAKEDAMRRALDFIFVAIAGACALAALAVLVRARLRHRAPRRAGDELVVFHRANPPRRRAGRHLLESRRHGHPARDGLRRLRAAGRRARAARARLAAHRHERGAGCDSCSTR